MNYKQALAWLYSLQRFGIKLGLENIERLLDELGLGSARGSRGLFAASPKTFTKVIHVAGTNGLGLRHDRFHLSHAGLSHRPVYIPSSRHVSRADSR